MVTWYIQVYGLGKVGLYVHQSLHGWHTQGHRSKGVRASYFGRPYCVVIPKLSWFRFKVYSVSDRYMGIGYGYKVWVWDIGIRYNCICRVFGVWKHMWRIGTYYI